MIKVTSLGMLDISKINPVLKKNSQVANYSFITDDGDVYLIANTITGDDAYKEDITFAANELLNGFYVKQWEAQTLLVDKKHIAFGDGQTYASSITAGTTILTVAESGKLQIAQSAPTSGIYFKVVAKTTLTEQAVKVKVCVVDKDTVYTPPAV